MRSGTERQSAVMRCYLPRWGVGTERQSAVMRCYLPRWGVGTESQGVQWWGVTCQDEEWGQKVRECGDEVLPAKMRSGDRKTGSAVMRCYLPRWGVGTESQGVRWWGVTCQKMSALHPVKLKHSLTELGKPVLQVRQHLGKGLQLLRVQFFVQLQPCRQREKIKATMMEEWMGQYTVDSMHLQKVAGKVWYNDLADLFPLHAANYFK